jgi:hypothetical protein
VRAHWPEDTVPVTVDGAEPGTADGMVQLLAEDAEAAAAGPADGGDVRLLGAFDPWLQLRDRALLVPTAAHAKDLWRTLGRPGAVVRDGEVIGTWRPRSSGGTLGLLLEPWTSWPRKVTDAVHEQAAALAAHRGAALGKLSITT